MSLKAPQTVGVIALAVVATVAGAALWQSAAKAPAPNAPPPPLKSAFTVPAVTQAQPAIATPAATPAVTPAAKPAAPAPTVAQASTPSAPMSAGQQAHIDPKTGQLRPAEHDDVAQLNSKAAGARRTARTAAAAEPQQFEAPGGGFGMAVPDEVQAYTVATKAPDGSIVLQHVTGPKQADAVVRANTAKAKHGMTVSKKEEPNDR